MPQAPLKEVPAGGDFQMHLTRADRNEIAALARRVERLAPSHRSPEHFHIEKSEIAEALRRIARRA